VVAVAGKFEVYQDRAGKYRFRLKAATARSWPRTRRMRPRPQRRRAASLSSARPPARRSRKSTP